MANARWLAALSLAALSACSSEGSDGSPDASTKADAGPVQPKPIPFPIVRMDDGQFGSTHEIEIPGVIAQHSTAQSVPETFNGVKPARVLSVREAGTTSELYYTLPKPFTFNALVNDQVIVSYRERAESFGSSFGAKVEGRFGGLRVLFDEGRIGPAFDTPEERLNFTIERDPQPLAEEADDCGRKVRYPAIIGQGEQRKRLFPGETATYTLTTGGDVEFTLLDLYRIEDAVCGVGAEFSVAYIILPKN